MNLTLQNYAPSTLVNDSDCGALINVSAGFVVQNICRSSDTDESSIARLFTICTLLFFGVRLMIRWPWNRLVGKDDIAVAIATVKLQPPLTLYSVQY
jgi:hypothetical protein